MSEYYEPNYYKKNGLSPIGAMQQGLLSKEEYEGFLKGNIIKYVVRSNYKGNSIKDLNKAKHYLELLLEHKNQEPKRKLPQ